MAINATQNVGFDITAVQEMVAQSTKNVQMAITQRIMTIVQQNGSKPAAELKGVIERDITPRLSERLEANGDKVRMIYQKLLAANSEFMQTNPLGQQTKMFVGMIGAQTSAELADEFVRHRVLDEAQALKVRLEEEQPAALNNTAIWS